MPTYEWKGSDRRVRQAISGELTAASKEAALASLKSAGIEVSSLAEAGGSGDGRPFNSSWRDVRGGREIGRVLRNGAIALGAFGAALLFSLLAPINTIRCDAARDCRIEHWTIATNERFVESLKTVERVAIETVEEIPVDGRGRPMNAVHHVMLVLHGATGQIATDSLQHPIPSGREAIETELQAFLDHPGEAGYVAWQADSGELILMALFVVAGLLAGAAALKAWRA